MNTENSKTSDTQRQILSLKDEVYLSRRGKHVAVSNLGMYYTWANRKKSYKNSKLKISPLI